MSEPPERSFRSTRRRATQSDLGAPRYPLLLGLADILVLAGADDQAALEGAAGDDERVLLA